MRSRSRRSLLGNSRVIETPLLAAMMEVTLSHPPKNPAPKLKVVVAGGHPGDPEYGCGGTIARYTELGHEVVLLYLNNGEWPPRSGSGPARMAEAARACEILRAHPLYAGQINGRAIVDQVRYDMFRKILEDEQPDVLLTHWPIDNHADHRAISTLSYDAWLNMNKSFALYYYEVSNGEDTVSFSPTHYVDISQTEPRKRLACYAHASQSPDKYYALQERVTRMRGMESGHRQAEAYICHHHRTEFPLAGA